VTLGGLVVTTSSFNEIRPWIPHKPPDLTTQLSSSTPSIPPTTPKFKMPRIAGLTPFTKADSIEKDSALADSGFHSEGEEDFASRPPTEQIKRRLSGVEHPAKKVPAWQNLTVSIFDQIDHQMLSLISPGLSSKSQYANESSHSPCTSVSPGISHRTRRFWNSALASTTPLTPSISPSSTFISQITNQNRIRLRISSWKPSWSFQKVRPQFDSTHQIHFIS
jgi:hypothetical protein